MDIRTEMGIYLLLFVFVGYILPLVPLTFLSLKRIDIEDQLKIKGKK